MALTSTRRESTTGPAQRFRRSVRDGDAPACLTGGVLDLSGGAGPPSSWPCALHDPPTATAAAPEQGLLQKGSFPGSYLLPGTHVSVRVGGYLEVDVIHDFNAIGSGDSFDPRTMVSFRFVLP